MIVTPLSGRTSAVRDALLSHGWEGDVSLLTAGGFAAAAFHVTGIGLDAIEAMVPVAGKLGLELVTGETWLIVGGARSRLGAFARPWMQPEPVRDLAMALGMAMPAEPPRGWRHARGTMMLDAPVIIGVVNVTPDSFSDGGIALTPDDALGRVEHLLTGGAAAIDVGGESTRPGARSLSAEEERQRVVPVLEAIVRRFPDLVISVDTVNGATARAALESGAAIVNDVTAGRHEPSLVTIAAEGGAGLVLSHSRGDLGALASYDHAEYGGDVVGEVARELGNAVVTAVAAGVASESIVIDPGFGFSKRPDQNFTLLDRLDAIRAVGLPVMVGVSRKRFLGDATGRAIDDRERATAAACTLAFDRGARLFRVHDPEAVRDALAIASAVARATG